MDGQRSDRQAAGLTDLAGFCVAGSAALIMIAVFGSFIFSPDPTTKSLGFALALGVLIDAFVVRMTVVPDHVRLWKGGLVVAALVTASAA